MGGGAFFHASSPGQPTLNTPRMSTETYAHLRHVYKERLLAYFPQVQLDTLIEAPDKHDHGDIDFVLANDGQIDFFDLASHLGARGTWGSGIRCISNMSFALNRTCAVLWCSTVLNHLLSSLRHFQYVSRLLSAGRVTLSAMYILT